MAVFRGGISKKRHRIAVALRVWDGGRHSHGGRGGVAEMAEMAEFVWFLSAVGVGPTRPNPTRLFIK